MNTAIVFPGQGTQHPGMCKELHDSFAVVRDTLAEADDALGFSLTRLMFDGPADQLALTTNCQPALLAAGVAQYRLLLEQGLGRVACMAGHSLGEYTALTCAGSLEFGDALRVVRERGRLMQEAVGVGAGMMVAILGLERAAVDDVLVEQNLAAQVQVANHNATQQVVASGLAPAVQQLVATVEGRGAVAIPLRVSAPFHSVHMAPAAAALRGHLDALQWRRPSCQVYSNVTGRPHASVDEVPALLERQMVATVEWVAIMDAFRTSGITRIVECGPGNVLEKLAKAHHPAWTTFGCATPERLADVSDALRTEGTEGDLIEQIGFALHALATTPNLAADLTTHEAEVAMPYKRLKSSYTQLRRGKADPAGFTPSDVRELLARALSAKALPKQVVRAKLDAFDSGLQPAR